MGKMRKEEDGRGEKELDEEESGREGGGREGTSLVVESLA